MSIYELKKTYYQLENDLDAMFFELTKSIKEIVLLSQELTCHYYNDLSGNMEEITLVGFDSQWLYDKQDEELDSISFSGFTTVDKVCILEEIADEIKLKQL